MAPSATTNWSLRAAALLLIYASCTHAALRGSEKRHSTSGEEGGKGPGLVSLVPDFFALVLDVPTLLAERPYAFAHEGPVYLPSENSVIFVSNRFMQDRNGSARNEFEVHAEGQGRHQYAEISKINLSSHEVVSLPEHVWAEQIPMGNGAFPDPSSQDSVLWLSQGTENKAAAIVQLNTRTFEVKTLLNDTSSMGGHDQFNSPNDIVADPITGALLFTDPVYGFFQGFRPTPRLGNWVWMYSQEDKTAAAQRPGTLRLLGDAFKRPNGIAFSENADSLYVTDTGYALGDPSITEISLALWLRTLNTSDLADDMDSDGPRTIYKFHVNRDEQQNIIGLSNRRVFAVAAEGIPDGIKVDCDGRVYAGTAGGVAVWDKNGQPLGIIGAGKACGQLVLVPRGQNTEIVMFCDTQIYSVILRVRTCTLAR